MQAPAPETRLGEDLDTLKRELMLSRLVQSTETNALHGEIRRTENADIRSLVKALYEDIDTLRA